MKIKHQTLFNVFLVILKNSVIGHGSKKEDPKYVTCRRYKRKTAKSGEQVCIYKGANNTYTLVVEGQCPNEYRCKYDPHGKEPNIDSVVDSLNDSFKK